MEKIMHQIKKEYDLGASSVQLAKKYGYGPSKIIYWIRKLGGEVKKMSEAKTKYSFNHNFFEKIDTKEKAYFLGFIFADGCVSDRELIISIHSKDESVLNNFIQAIEGDNKIRHKTSMCHLGGKNETPMSTVSIRSDKFLEDLSKMGCCRRKTKKMNIPILSPKLEPHFWRGFLDGDGWISNYQQRGSPFFESGIIGLENVIGSFEKFLRKNNIKGGGISKDKGMYRFRISGVNGIKMLDMLYKNSNENIELKRKKENYVKAKRDQEKKSETKLKNKTSKYRGVSKNSSGSWVASYYINSVVKQKYLGCFPTEDAAYKAWLDYDRKVKT